MLTPINNLPKCNGTEYSLQLSIYAILLELMGMTCEKIHLVHLKPPTEKDNDPKPLIMPIRYLKNSVISMFKDNLATPNVKPKKPKIGLI